MPVMNPSAKVVNVFGNGLGMALVLDQKAGHLSCLDDSVYELTLLLVESDPRDFEVDLPANGRYLGSFFSEHWGAPFMAFALDRSPAGARRASSGKGS